LIYQATAPLRSRLGWCRRSEGHCGGGAVEAGTGLPSIVFGSINSILVGARSRSARSAGGSAIGGRNLDVRVARVHQLYEIGETWLVEPGRGFETAEVIEHDRHGRVHNQVLDLMPDITLRNTVNGAPLYNPDATRERLRNMWM